MNQHRFAARCREFLFDRFGSFNLDHESSRWGGGKEAKADTLYRCLVGNRNIDIHPTLHRV